MCIQSIQPVSDISRDDRARIIVIKVIETCSLLTATENYSIDIEEHFG